MEIFSTLLTIEKTEFAHEETLQEEKKEKQQIRRFFYSIQSFLTSFLRDYVENDPTKINAEALQIFITQQNKSLSEEQKNLLIYGLVKNLNHQIFSGATDDSLHSTISIVTEFVDNIDPLEFKIEIPGLKEMLNEFLERFQTLKVLYHEESKERSVSTLKKGLIFCIWILLLFKEKGLIEEWVLKIENLLSQVSKQPRVLLASIKGIQKLFELNKAEHNKEELQMFKNITDSIFRLTIKKSWELLDNVEFHGSAINLIFQLNSQNKQKMFDLLENHLHSKDQNTSIKYLQRLVTFWKLAQTFELSAENEQLERFVIFKLLEFLEDQHPVKRQIAKSWLIDSNEHFQNILDYMIITLLQNSHFYLTNDGQIFHYDSYDTIEIMKVYTRMKYLITNNQSQFVRYMNRVPLSDRLIIEMFQQMSSDEINQFQYYYQVLLELLKRFMQAQCLSVYSQKFKDENVLVQTSSCETLEILINCLAVTNTALFDKRLLKSIIKSYFLNVDNEVQVM